MMNGGHFTSRGIMSIASQSNARLANDDAARIISQHQAGVWRYLRALGCDPSLADDLTQDTFLRVLRQPIREYSTSATASYLRKAAYHRFVSYHRAQGRQISTIDLEQVSQDWERWASSDQAETLLEALRECLTQLTGRARKALELRFRDRQSRNEIASALGVGPHGAKNVLQRAKHQLRLCIENKLQ